MIYFLSDQHGGEKIGELQKYLNTARDDDLLIVLGDVGLRFRDTDENRAFDELFLSSNKKIAFLDGNHENFDYIYSFPEEELARAYSNLRACGYKVDYVLTHKYEEGKGTRTEELLSLCRFIDEKVDFKHYYAGHWHTTRREDKKHTFVYDTIIPLD